MFIALAQFNPTSGALRENSERALAIIDELAKLPYAPDLVIFPAHALTGANLGGLIYHEAFGAECVNVANNFAERAKLPTLIGTKYPRLLEDDHSLICEPEVLFCRDGYGSALGFVDSQNEWHDKLYASSIDITFDDYVLTVVLNDYPEQKDNFSHSDLIVMMLSKEYLGAGSLLTSSTQLKFLREIASNNRTWMAVTNLVGGQDSIVFDGGSVVLDSLGGVRDSADPFAEQVITVPLELNTAPKITKTTLAHHEDRKMIKPLLPYEADWHALVLATRDYVQKSGFSQVVIGLSGGLDSAVTAALAVEALGSENVHGVLMPGPFSSQGSIDDAKALAEILGITTSVFSITSLFELFKTLSTENLNTEGSALAQENLQARLRMIILMHLANTHNWLLLTTSNKSEIAVGYSTLYGDMAGTFAPIANVYKTDVYGLVEWRNGTRRVIPQAIIEKTPSAELSFDQKDSDSLPPYEVLDRILRLHIERDYGVDQIVHASRHESGELPLDPELVLSVLKMVKRAEFKRRQASCAPTLGSVDMNNDRSWPINCGFDDRIRRTAPLLSSIEQLNDMYMKSGPHNASLADLFEN